MLVRIRRAGFPESGSGRRSSLQGKLVTDFRDSFMSVLVADMRLRSVSGVLYISQSTGFRSRGATADTNRDSEPKEGTAD